jgi:hypothetical protein
MGEDDMAVVDGQGRVHGVQGLRVVDASIMPLIITGNLNATTIMIAEKIADQIRGKNSLVLKRLITKRVQHLYVKRRYVQYYKEEIPLGIPEAQLRVPLHSGRNDEKIIIDCTFGFLLSKHPRH